LFTQTTQHYQHFESSDVSPKAVAILVLQRCGSDKLHEQLEELTNIVEELGGRTRYTDDRENAATPDELEEDDHVA
jgi:hypothetical protein